MSKLIALIDADGLLYAAALQGQMNMDGEDKPIAMTTVEVVYKDACQRIENEVTAVERAMKGEVDEVFICLSDRRNFRYDILATYKGQRKASDRPILLDGLRKKFDEDAPYTVMLIEGLEADDVCGISAGTLQRSGATTVIVSPDKDLATIPGYVLCKHKGQHTLTLVTQQMADDWHMMQALMGDTCDNYRGCPGWGVRKAGDLIDLMNFAGLSQAEKWAQFVVTFEESGLTEADALVQARVSRILRVEDWDAQTKEVRLFNFPPMPN